MREVAPLLLIFAAAGLTPVFAPGLTAPAFAVLTYALLGMAANFEFAWAGLPDFSLVIWFALGAVASQALASRSGLPVWAALPFCAAAAAVAAFAVVSNLLVLRRELIAMVTLAAASLVSPVLTAFPALLHGAAAPLTGNGVSYYLLTAISVLAGAGFAGMRASPFAHRLGAIRDDEAASLGAGLNAEHDRAAVAAISAALAAAAGCLWPAQFSLAPENFGFGAAAGIFAIAVIAGRQISGVIVPAILIGGIPQLVPALSPYRALIAGAAILAWFALRRFRPWRRAAAADGWNLFPAAETGAE